MTRGCGSDRLSFPPQSSLGLRRKREQPEPPPPPPTPPPQPSCAPKSPQEDSPWGKCGGGGGIRPSVGRPSRRRQEQPPIQFLPKAHSRTSIFPLLAPTPRPPRNFRVCIPREDRSPPSRVFRLLLLPPSPPHHYYSYVLALLFAYRACPTYLLCGVCGGRLVCTTLVPVVVGFNRVLSGLNVARKRPPRPSQKGSALPGEPAPAKPSLGKRKIDVSRARQYVAALREGAREEGKIHIFAAASAFLI